MRKFLEKKILKEKFLQEEIPGGGNSWSRKFLEEKILKEKFLEEEIPEGEIPI